MHQETGICCAPVHWNDKQAVKEDADERRSFVRSGGSCRIGNVHLANVSDHGPCGERNFLVCYVPVYDGANFDPDSNFHGIWNSFAAF